MTKVQYQLQAHYKPKKQTKALLFLLGSGGIFFSYIIYAIFAQRLYNMKYQSIAKFRKDGTPYEHKFTHPNFVVMLNCMCCAIFGYIRSHLTNQRPNPISTKESIISGLFYSINSTAMNFSLLYLSYPTQVISSSVRYLLVVLVGSFFSRLSKVNDLKIPKHKIYVAMVITCGVVLFNVMRLNGRHKHVESNGFLGESKGYILVLSAMIADAFFCDTQAYIKSTFKPTVNHMFTTTNFYAFLFSLTYSLTTGCFFIGVKFLAQHPSCLTQILAVCLCQVCGQVSIYYIIANFKQHVFPLISTIRKTFTILCSIMLFNHKLSGLQWVALGIIFVGMSIEVYEEVLKKKRQEKEGMFQMEVVYQSEEAMRENRSVINV